MTLTKRQKQLAAAALLTGTCFLVDSLFFGPAGASASPDAPIAAALSAPETAASSAYRPSDLQNFGARGVAQRLRATTRPSDRQLTASRDIFFPNGISKPAPVQTEPLPPPPVQQALVDPAVEFVSRYKLRAIMIAGGQSVALINDRLVHVGQSVGGYKLVHLETKAARLEKPGSIVRLTLSDVNLSNDLSSPSILRR